MNISNTGDGTLSWTANDNAPWLTLSPASGTGNGAVTLTVTTGTLIAGSYSTTVTLNATGAASVTVPVTFTVATAPVPPAIGVSPTSLSFTAIKGGADPATQTLSISNTGGGTLNWTAVDNASWLTLLTLLGQASGINSKHQRLEPIKNRRRDENKKYPKRTKKNEYTFHSSIIPAIARPHQTLGGVILAFARTFFERNS